MSVDIKKEILRVLKEDEEFRYTVAGLIGIEDLRRGQGELRLGLAKLEESVARLEHAIAKLAEEQRRTSRTLRYLIRYIDQVSIILEEEARSIIGRRLREKGITLSLGMLVRPYVELDIYGSNGYITIVGDAKTRLAPKHVKLLQRKIEKIQNREPELLKGKIIKTIYALWVHPEALEECKISNIWLNTPDKELSGIS